METASRAESRAERRAESSNRTDKAQDRAGPTQPLIAISSHLILLDSFSAFTLQTVK
jgi:hypothetical protein